MEVTSNELKIKEIKTLEKMPLKEVVAYTDGSCLGNPGPGGWGAVLFYGEHEKELSGGEEKTTNNRMEMMAVIEVFRALKEPVILTIYTDSKYVMDGATQWMAGWKSKNWTKKGGLKNADLWQILDAEITRVSHHITWEWVKGHAGIDGNERADALAVAAAEKYTS